MKKKLCIVGLISLFTWNALLGAFGGLLLCIHQDLELHVDGAAACETVCMDIEKADAPASCVALDESCVDVELAAEQLPVIRLKSETASCIPEVLFAVLVEYVPLTEPTHTLVDQSTTTHAPPQARWLTDFYLQTTVLRV